MSPAAGPADPAFEALLDFLHHQRGLDFTGYKRTSLERRVRRRMDQVRCRSFEEYLDFLEVHPDEYADLLNVILINVTEFFRDPATWEHLQANTLPALLAGKPPAEPIRVWSAGCATGQEPCTLAMVLAELLGIDAYRERVKIYATDIDEEALAVARQATYGPREMEGLPEALRERYFEHQGQAHVFRKDLRRTLIFGRNNLVADAPISRLDLLVCRNTLMYFTAETQGRILRHFHFALRDEGVLMLGRSELLTFQRDLFATDDLMKRVFRKLPHSASLQTRVAVMARPEAPAPPGSGDDEDARARAAALEAAPQPQLVVSRAGVLRFANRAARSLFGLGETSLGRSLADLPIGRAPADLRGAVGQALRDRARVIVGEVAFTPPDGEPCRLVVSVLPLGGDQTPVGVSISFEDVTRYATLQEEVERNRNDLEAAYEELESTIDELETTNEELQSANEELQTTNEELQSTNEELETMNEELSSTNEELGSINDELRERTGELNQVNDFLEVILTSLGVAVAVVDRSGLVQLWNRGAEELWGVRREEAVDQHFLGLDIGLGPERLAPVLRSVMAGGEGRKDTLDAVNRRGRPIRCAVSVLPLSSGDGDGSPVRGAVVLMRDPDAEGAEPAATAVGHERR